MAQVNFEPGPYRSQSWRFNHSTTMPRIAKCVIFFNKKAKYCSVFVYTLDITKIDKNFFVFEKTKFNFVVIEGKSQSAPRRKVPACLTIKTEFNN